jgi:hypothetical protein
MNNAKGAYMSYILGMLVVLCFVSLMEVHSSHEKNKRLQRDLTYFDTTYLRKSGYTAFWSGTNGVNYDLRSFDAGKNWYAVEMDTAKDTLIIKGPAETVYPGLMKTLQDWDNIVQYAEKHGPLNPNNADDVELLMKNGFTVTHKTN